MSHLKDMISAKSSIGDGFDELEKRRSERLEKRVDERLDFLRPIFFSCQGIAQFHQGAILNYSTGGMCLHAGFPIDPLTMLLITTCMRQNVSFFYRTGETVFAKAVWCEMKAGAYRIGLRVSGSPSLMDPSEFEYETTLPEGSSVDAIGEK